MKNTRVVILFLFFIFLPKLHAQSIDQAGELYKKGEYRAALPAYEKAVSVSPTNALYNFIYGECLLNTGNPRGAEKYLKYAVSKSVKGSKLKLAVSYYRQYKFAEAADLMNAYIYVLSKMKNVSKELSEAKDLMSKSEQAERMLNRCEDIQMIDSIKLDKKNFLKAYRMMQESGSLSEKNNTVVYENQLGDKRYFALRDSSKTYKLYTQNNIQGNWTDETSLKIPEDSTDIGDDNYPFVLTDGITVYFASKGRHSIGGYDLFVTRYNNDNGSFLQPAQLGMPFNSIDNDYMYAVDDLHNIGYFATDRFQNKDSVIVYMFIPNAEKKFIDNKDKNYLARRAMILSVKDSWQKDKSYQSVKEDFFSDIAKEGTRVHRDFTFYINDKIVYYKLSDFECAEARQLFSKSLILKKHLDEMTENLDTMRKKYSEGNPDVRKELTDVILKEEKELPDLENEYKDTSKQVRNAEIRYLNDKKH